jgi:hypothetical protein
MEVLYMNKLFKVIEAIRENDDDGNVSVVGVDESGNMVITTWECGVPCRYTLSPEGEILSYYNPERDM